jgi:hypothetical protein
MGQLTVRASDGLVDRVRLAARQAGRSMNEYVTGVLEAATDPELAGDEAEGIRQRLARAGLLASTGSPRPRPDAEHVAVARAAAGRGTPLSTIVASDRS